MNKGDLRAYRTHGHHLVKGWLYPGAAEAIVLLSEEQRRSNLSGPVGEIGVHHGKLFILLYLLAQSEERAVAIDLFSHQELNVDRSGAGDLERFRKNLRRHAGTERLVIHEGDSTLLAPEDLLKLGGGPFRMISVDGGHTTAVTAHDLATSEGALMEGGILILDDCFKEMWPGVVTGVERHFAQPRSVVPFALGANKTFFCHRPYAQNYAAVLRGLEGKIVEQEFLGYPVLCFEFEPWSIGRWYRRVDAFRAVRKAYHDVLSRFYR
jgi:hypothetical protein